MKKIYNYRYLSVFLVTALTGFQALASDRVIYGEDSRKDFFEVTQSAFRDWGRSTAVLIPTKELVSVNDNFQLSEVTFEENDLMCPQEPFAKQPSPGLCSGFLAAPDIFVTAGHCISTQEQCDSLSIVFDFIATGNGNVQTKIPKSEVYTCKKIIASTLTNFDSDFAVVKLDRPVFNRAPLKLRESGKIEDGEDLLVIGHPAGLPQKFADGNVRENAELGFFRANTDSYGGNSGGPVINPFSGLVEGIISRGEKDFEVNESGECFVSKRCENNSCRGEDITRTSQFIPYIKNIFENPNLIKKVFTSENSTIFNIPDNNSDGVILPITFSNSPQGIIIKATFEVKFTHPSTGDIEVELITPDGRSYSILKNETNRTGSLHKTFEFYSLNLKQLNSNYKLKISDKVRTDVGSLTYFKLSFTTVPAL